jgi:hypothetical protein
MTPSPQETYDLVVKAMRRAKADSAFGRSLLLGGKTKGIARELWLCKCIARTFTDAGFCVEPERLDGRRGRIDIAILSREDHHLECAIEAKFYFCHSYRRREKGHLYLRNTLTDFRKRKHLGSSQQAIILAIDYKEMPSNGRAQGLFQAEMIRRYLKDDEQPGFARFECDLFDLFERNCNIFPSRNAQSVRNQAWQAKYGRASAVIRAWILEFRRQQHASRNWGSATRRDPINELSGR